MDIDTLAASHGDHEAAHHAAELIEATRIHLATAKGKISEAIRNYPPPIPACDQQFNHLLEERHRLGAALRRLDVIKEQILSARDQLEAIQALIRESPDLGSL